MTNQQIYDRVRKHLLRQKAAAVAADGCCQYRTPDGLRCAVGCLIPKKLYSPGIEGYPVALNSSLWEILRKVGIHRRTHSVILTELQGIHDSRKPSMWKKELDRLAKDLGLKVVATKRRQVS